MDNSYSVENIRKKHRNAYQPWTAEEEAELIGYSKQGLKDAEIAQKLGRQIGGIKSRLEKISNGSICSANLKSRSRQTIRTGLKPHQSLGPEQQAVFGLLVSGVNVLLTGQAGTGKTFLLNRFIDYLKSKKISVGLTASTGVAATHLGGQTIHSWAGFGIKEKLSVNDLENITNNLVLSEKIRETKVLIIDEISMLHSYQLDMVDQITRTVLENERPFGGLQVVLCGDFYQLPPVSRDRDGSKFVTDSRVWKIMDIKVCYLREQYRQADTELLTILNEIRDNSVTSDSIDRLTGRVSAGFAAEIESTKLHTHNAIADAYNLDKLEHIDAKSHTYQMKSGGKAKIVHNLVRDCLAPEELVLKKGAVVMFVRNNIAKGYVNGTTGRVVDFNDDGFPVVEMFGGKKRVAAEPEKWKVEEGARTVAWIAQVPLRLAWAITIHKSQGMTLEYIEIDLSRAFTYSLGYVALSRARSLEGISLKGFNKLSLMVSDEAIKIDTMLREIAHQFSPHSTYEVE